MILDDSPVITCSECGSLGSVMGTDRGSHVITMADSFEFATTKFSTGPNVSVCIRAIFHLAII